MTAAPFPFDRVPRISREQARAESTIAHWLAIRRRSTTRLATLVKAEPASLHARIVASSVADFDPYAATCILKLDGFAIEVRGSSLGVRSLARRILGGPAELAAPRPLNVVEQSIWCLVVATALEDLGVPGIVWPSSGSRTTTPAGHSASARSLHIVEIEADLAGVTFAIQLHVPSHLELSAPAARSRPGSDARTGGLDVPAWAERAMLEVPIVVGRSAIARSDVGRLMARSLVTIDVVGQSGVVDRSHAGATTAWGPRPRQLRGQAPTVAAAELEIFGGVVGIRVRPGAVVGEVATGYLPRDMSLPDDAHVELTVGLGTTRMSLRQVFELAVGQVVTLGRPLAGPFELRAAGKLVGKGELVDVDGELAVRIVSLGDQE